MRRYFNIKCKHWNLHLTVKKSTKSDLQKSESKKIIWIKFEKAESCIFVVFLDLDIYLDIFFYSLKLNIS